MQAMLGELAHSSL